MVLDGDAVGLPVLVIGAGDKGFDGFYVHLLHARQLAHLQQPVSLKLLGSGLVAHIGDGQAVGEPLAAQLGKQGGLANALRAIEDEDRVEFHAGIVDSGNTGDKRLSGDGAGVRRVRCAEVIDEQCVDARDAVPH